MDSDLAEFARAVAGAGVTVETDVPFERLTTLRVGGPARIAVVVEDEASLVRVAAAATGTALPLLVVGRGSNLLMGDEGWPGIVVRLGAGFRGISIEGTRVRAGAAEPMPSVAVATAQAGLTGFAWGAAVPGSIGGGVRMNAGAHGADMAASLVVARVVDTTTGHVEERDASGLALAYRSSALAPTDVVTAVELELETAASEDVLAEIDAIRTWRREHQPLNRPSCGSVFTNPEGASAGALIERAGLKGVRIGGAEVSTMHANFIVTGPDARASDVAALIELVTERVAAHAGVTLRAEVVRPVPPHADA